MPYRRRCATRMEIIELTGYTEEEKLQIATALPAHPAVAANGLNASQVDVSERRCAASSSTHPRAV